MITLYLFPLLAATPGAILPWWDDGRGPAGPHVVVSRVGRLHLCVDVAGCSGPERRRGTGFFLEYVTHARIVAHHVVLTESPPTVCDMWEPTESGLYMVFFCIQFHSPASVHFSSIAESALPTCSISTSYFRVSLCVSVFVFNIFRVSFGITLRVVFNILHIYFCLLVYLPRSCRLFCVICLCCDRCVNAMSMLCWATTQSVAISLFLPYVHYACSNFTRRHARFFFVVVFVAVVIVIMICVSLLSVSFVRWCCIFFLSVGVFWSFIVWLYYNLCSYFSRGVFCFDFCSVPYHALLLSVPISWSLVTSYARHAYQMTVVGNRISSILAHGNQSCIFVHMHV